MTKRGIRREISDRLIAVKMPSSLVENVDQDAAAEGISRADVIRRHLMRAYASRVPAVVNQ